MEFEYRVTKYDPRHRDQEGRYTVDEWIMFSQIGKVFNGKQFTIDDYQRTENAYVDTALSYLTEAEALPVCVRQLEDPHGEAAKIGVADRDLLDRERVVEMMRLALRARAWCRLVSSNAFVHFGYDYYMYIGVTVDCCESRALAVSRGLFVEDFRSPYHENG